MSRYVQVGTPERIQQALKSAKGEIRVGPELGSLCLKAELPWTLVCKALGVTRPTIYRWVFGESRISGEANRRNVAKLIRLIQHGLQQKILPAEKPADGLRKTMAALRQPLD